MKQLVLAASAVLGVLAALSSASPAPATKSASVAQDYTMIRTILNGSPAQVSKALGAADGPIQPSKDCDYLPSCNETTYQHKKFEALFFKNRLKWLVVNQPGLMTVDLLSRLGFRSFAPTFSNPGFIIAWRSAESPRHGERSIGSD